MFYKGTFQTDVWQFVFPLTSSGVVSRQRWIDSALADGSMFIRGSPRADLRLLSDQHDLLNWRNRLDKMNDLVLLFVPLLV